MHELAERPAVGRMLRQPFLDRALLAERHELLGAAAEELGAAVAEHGLDPLREIAVAPGGVGLPNVLAGGFGHGAEALLALDERPRRAAALAHVAEER